MSNRLPIPGGDSGSWGDILNAYLEVSLAGDGTINPNVVGTAQLQNNCVTNAQLDVPTQTTLAAVVSKYVKPVDGIPATDMTTGVQISLGDANTAVQSVNNKTGTSVSLNVADLGDVNTASGASNNQVLSYDSTTSQWVPATVSSTIVNNATDSSPGIIQLSGDLGGTATSPTVAKLDGIAVSGTPSTGNALVATGTSAASWGSISAANVAGGLQASNNLSDVSSAGVARQNLHISALLPAACVAASNVSSLSGLQTFDGYTLTASDQVLLIAQSTASQNGPWIASSGTWTRPTDFATGNSVEARSIQIIQGTTYSGSTYLLQTNSSITVDTTAQTWVSQLPSGVVVSSAAPSGAGLVPQSTGTDSAVTWVTSGTTESILIEYGISGLGTAWAGSGSASSKVITTTTNHDFEVGHGIRVYGASSASATSYTPSAPTISSKGTNDASTSYTYCVALITAGSNDYVSPASNTTGFSGNSSLSTSNYNQVQWTPPGSAPGGIQGYAVYGRTSGSLQLLGTAWWKGPTHFSAAASTNIPPYLGSNLSASTLYTYTLTGVDFSGNECPVFSTTSVTTGSTVTGVTLTWDFAYGPSIPYRYFNVYRNNGFMQQVPVTDLVWQDAGTIAPSAQTQPTTLTFSDTGQAATQGPVGVLPNVPLTASSSSVNASLVTTVTATTNNTITLSAAMSPALTNTTICHDDTAAINAALSAKTVVTLPTGYYFISGSGLTVPAAGALIGTPGGWTNPVTVTVASNPLPGSGMTTLVFTGLSSPGVTLAAAGASAHWLQLFWPYQGNGKGNASSEAIGMIPYPPGIYCGGIIGCNISDIVDCNSWVAFYLGAGDLSIQNIYTGTLRWTMLLTNGEPTVRNVRGDRAEVYSSGADCPRVADAAAVRGAGANLGLISNIGVDGITEVWWTTSGSSGGGGNIGCVISDVWNDDWGTSIILDSPTSEPYNGGGQNFQYMLSNIYAMRGGGAIVISTGDAAFFSSGGNLATVHIINSYLAAGVQATGQMSLHIANSTVEPGITCAATSPVSSPALIKLNLSNVTTDGEVSRINVTSGDVKAYIASPGTYFSGGAGYDSVSAGANLYVIDEQALHTSRFRIPAGTTLTAGANTIDNILLPQNGSYGHASPNYFYVVSATGNGTSSTDQWEINGTSLLTTSVSSGGLYINAIGEGYAYSNTSAYVFQNPSGTKGHFSVLPIVLNVAANVTTTTSITCEIVWCLTPLAA